MPGRKKVLTQAVTNGYKLLESGHSSTDAAEEAIRVIEDSKIFNAGSGSSLTIEGNIEPDAGIMNGDLTCGSVANASIAKNPISLARVVMEKTDHVFIAGRDALIKVARSANFKTFELKPTEERLREYDLNLRRMRAKKDKTWPRNLKLMGRYGYGDTIGSVALDSLGQITAAVSTGGRFMKLPGRVGDSPLVGSGLYADNNVGGASATGAGEDIIRICLCKTVCDFMKSGLNAQMAADASIELISKVRGIGTAGVIAIDHLGNLGISRNTKVMPTAHKFSNMSRVVAKVI